MTVREARQPDRRGIVEACGTTHTAQGWERRKQRDKARQRARMDVRNAHREEFDGLLEADPDRREARKYARALRVIAARHPDLYERCYLAELAAVGYESHPCNPLSTATTLTGETSGPGAALTAPVPPEPGKGSEMAERRARQACGF